MFLERAALQIGLRKSLLSRNRKNTTTSVTSNTDLAARETRIYKLDLDKLKTVPADLSKLSNVVNNYAINKLCISIDYQI